ncbi:replication endonuclease, partial [Vibrio alginolyticus]
KGSSLSGSDAAERVVTWARVNQIRQFQFIGGPSVTVWRELRRLRDEFKEDDALFTDLSQDEHFLLEKVRRSADEGDWKAFCYAMGGVFVKRKDQPVKAEYSVSTSIEKLIASGGEYSSTRYGDMAYEKHLALYDEMEALLLTDPQEINASCWVGAAPPDMMH